MEEFANFDFNTWRKRYIQWISHLKSRILDVFRSIDRDQDGRITQKEFIDYVLASSKTHMLSFQHCDLFIMFAYFTLSNIILQYSV